MFKEININLDVERTRKDVYDIFIKHWSDEYVFTNNNDYIWFNENIIKQNKNNITILSFNEVKTRFQWGKSIKINISFLDNWLYNVEIKSIELIKYNNDKLPDFVKGEN